MRCGSCNGRVRLLCVPWFSVLVLRFWCKRTRLINKNSSSTRRSSSGHKRIFVEPIMAPPLCVCSRTIVRCVDLPETAPCSPLSCVHPPPLPHLSLSTPTPTPHPYASRPSRPSRSSALFDPQRAQNENRRNVNAASSDPRNTPPLLHANVTNCSSLPRRRPPPPPSLPSSPFPSPPPNPCPPPRPSNVPSLPAPVLALAASLDVNTPVSMSTATIASARCRLQTRKRVDEGATVRVTVSGFREVKTVIFV